MNANLLLNHTLTFFTCITAGIIFLLLPVSINADGFIRHHDQTNKEVRLQRDDPDPRMFLIAVIDSKDDTIGERCKEDLDGMTDEFEYVAGKIHAQWIAPKIIEGNQFSKASVNDAIDNWLKNQQPSENDIVIFYYSGHGFRYPGDASDYPRMWLKTATDRNPETTNLRMEEDIYNRIIKMGAGINIVLSDCCNSTVAGANSNVDNVMVPTHKRTHSDDDKTDDDDNNGHKLFTPGQPLSILATAASKGELASGKADDGSFFTAFFLDDLDYVLGDDSKEATWESIFRYADENAGDLARSSACPEAKHNEQGRCVQTAQIKITGGN